MNPQTWNAAGYEKNARFVTDLGAPVLQLLAPIPNERILDVGCGDGVLTKKIVDAGSHVVGLDSSPDLCAAARRLGLEIVEMSASDMAFEKEFDAVFPVSGGVPRPSFGRGLRRAVYRIDSKANSDPRHDGLAHDVLSLLHGALAF